MRPNPLNFLNNLMDIGVTAIGWRDSKPQLSKVVQRLGVSVQALSLQLLDIKDKDAQLSFRCQLGNLLAKRSRRSVSGIFKRLFLVELLLLHQLLETLVRHVDLPPNL